MGTFCAVRLGADGLPFSQIKQPPDSTYSDVDSLIYLELLIFRIEFADSHTGCASFRFGCAEGPGPWRGENPSTPTSMTPPQFKNLFKNKLKITQGT